MAARTSDGNDDQKPCSPRVPFIRCQAPRGVLSTPFAHHQALQWRPWHMHRRATLPRSLGVQMGTPPHTCQRSSRLHAVALDKLYTSQAQAMVEKYSFQIKGGGRFAAEVRRLSSKYEVTLTVEDVVLQPWETPMLQWGAYRSSPSKWFHPQDMVPMGSMKHDATGSVRTPMTQSVSPTHPDKEVAFVKLTVPEDLVPVMIGCVVWVDSERGEGAGRYVIPQHGKTFTVPVGMSAGFCSPLGPSLVAPLDALEESFCVNFAVVSRHAASMSLCLARAQDGPGTAATSYLEVALDPVVNKTGDVWHVALEGLRRIDSLAYGWRAGGDVEWQDGDRYTPGLVLLDPFAPIITSAILPEGAHVPPMDTGQPPLPELAPGEAVLGSLACLTNGAVEPPMIDALQVDLEDAIVLELDVYSFSQDGEVEPRLQGTFLGLLERLDYIKAIGVNVVMLQPVYATSVGPHRGGSAPLSWLSPAPSLSSTPSDPLSAHQDFRSMVNALHDLDIEVWVQLEFCDTAEGRDPNGSPVSLRGLDGGMYYREGVLNVGHSATWPLVIGSLQHWLDAYNVDGFCVVNAETLCLDREGVVLDNPWVPEALAMHHTLRYLKLIAWPGSDELLPRGGERGFPHWGTWMERNRRFLRDFQQYLVQGAPAMASTIATRITGSADLFASRWDGTLPGGLACGRRPSYGLNSAGFLGRTSLVEVMGEQAGNTSLTKAMLVAVLFSQGVPCITQDAIQDAEYARFVGIAARVRQRYIDLLQPMAFDSPRDIRWHGAGAGSEPDWEGIAPYGEPSANVIGFSIRQVDGRGVFVAFNPHVTASAVGLPDVMPGTMWAKVIDTSREAPEDALIREVEPVVGASIAMGPQSAIVLELIPATGA